MVEFVKGKSIIGPVLTIFGGLLLVLTPAFIPGFSVLVIMAVIFGIISLLGGCIAATGNNLGNYIAIIIGLIATIGTNFFVATMYFEPILVLVGGVLGVLIKEE